MMLKEKKSWEEKTNLTGSRGFLWMALFNSSFSSYFFHNAHATIKRIGILVVVFKLPILSSSLIKAVSPRPARVCSSREEALGSCGCPSWGGLPFPRRADGWA